MVNLCPQLVPKSVCSHKDGQCDVKYKMMSRYKIVTWYTSMSCWDKLDPSAFVPMIPMACVWFVQVSKVCCMHNLWNMAVVEIVATHYVGLCTILCFFQKNAKEWWLCHHLSLSPNDISWLIQTIWV
jgi:hypothetical protein